MTVTVRNLAVERTRLLLSVLGVGFAVLLVLVMAGIFVGTTRQATTYIDHSGIDHSGIDHAGIDHAGIDHAGDAVWAVQPGVGQMFRAVSWLPAETGGRLQSLPEVGAAEPILGQPSDFVHNGTQTAYFVVGYDPATGVGGPWSLASGRTLDRTGEVVLDRVLAGKNDIRIGDTVQIIDGDFTVVGLSNQTAALGNFYAFVSLPDAARLMRAGNRVSYFLVRPAAGFTAAQTATAIRDRLPGTDALTSAEFSRNSREIIISMIGRPLKAMIAVAALVGVALIGLTMLAATTEQRGDFGVLRAVGVRPFQLCGIVLGQAAIIAALGYLLGASLAYALQFLIRDRLGDVTIAVTPGMLVAMVAGTAVMAGIGSLVPLLRVMRVDPAQAFRR